jgi:hypothetical protein
METPTPPPLKLGRVQNLHGARRALLRITQAVLDGTIEPRQGNCAIYGLSAVVKCLEVEVIERRLDALEGQLAAEVPRMPTPARRLNA